MAALYALSIDNIIIETDSAELPGLDGSGLGFFDALKAAGSSEQSSPARVIKIKEPLWCEKKDAFLGIFPSEILKISYFFESRSPVLGRQAMTLDATPEAVIKEILPARTFCLKEEAEMLLKLGFGKGANTDNTLVLDKDGPVKNAFRYPDEPVRHKILDLVGDLYLAGRVQGRVIAIRSGHDLNMELVQKVRKQV
jgi:UDP-3-O-acyl N-acetylglucosamine deacetylase